ncbi:MAG: hypothetical protein SFU85_02005 [Candidatus Methylacidiphilales bacterium]|nr:hypothetical protein [Candidatus Methylacidiphilales bacterium]
MNGLFQRPALSPPQGSRASQSARSAPTVFLSRLLFLCLFSITQHLSAQNPAPFRPIEPVQARGNTVSDNTLPARVEERIKLFFSTLAEQSIEQAFLKLFDGSKLLQEKDAIDSFTQVTRGSIQAYGRIKYYNLLDSRRIGDRLLLLTYIVEHEKRPVRWRFLFFAPIGNDWTLANLKADDLRNYFPSIPSSAKPPEPVFLKNEKFFINLQSGAIPEAFADLILGSELAGEAAAVKAFEEKARQSEQEYGKILSYNLLDNRPLSPRLRLLTYLVSTEKKPLRWQFFYRLDPQTGVWILTNVRMDDLLDASFLID